MKALAFLITTCTAALTFASCSTPGASDTSSHNKSVEGDLCGGIGGFICSEGFECDMRDPNVPDGAGTCIPIEPVEELTLAEQLEQLVNENLPATIEKIEEDGYFGLTASETGAFGCTAELSMESREPVGACLVNGEMSLWVITVADLEQYPTFGSTQISYEL